MANLGRPGMLRHIFRNPQTRRLASMIDDGIKDFKKIGFQQVPLIIDTGSEQVPPIIHDPSDREKGSSIHHLITSSEADVTAWITEHIDLPELFTIGVSVEADADTNSIKNAEASVITLCVGDQCLSYTLGRNGVICNTMTQLLNNNNILFAGNRNANMQALIRQRQIHDSTLGVAGQLSLVKMENQKHFEEEIDMQKSNGGQAISWKVSSLTIDQARFTRLQAFTAWRLATHQPPPHHP